MGPKAAMTHQMRNPKCVLHGTARKGDGNVMMGRNVSLTVGCVMDYVIAMTNQMRILQCVLSGNVVLMYLGNVRMD